MAAKKLVTIKLVALGEHSALTGRKTLRKGDTLDVEKKVAEEAVASKRWVYATADDEKAAEEGEGA